MATLSGSSGIVYHQLKERKIKQETCEESNCLPVSAHPSNINSDSSTMNGLGAPNVPIVSSFDPTQCGMLNQLEPSFAAEEEELQESPEIDIVINNVVCNFNVRCHLNLRQIALTGSNVEYRRENGMLTMKIRNPGSTASIWSSGKVTCTGATSEDAAKKAARKTARILQKLGFRIRFTNFRIVNVLGTCTMPFKINIVKFSRENRDHASYEPELHPGVTYKIKDIKATMKIFSTGSITIT
ncbi:TATA box-binding protein-like protein 1, partial [Limulus polyphemus]|uniref:TATA box-binding protein-like protein 1 n=1 Tax=Limulus polyphemus TaxID=6850 RepID=A0ABM1BPG2_LIMPO